jgi:predicted Na+-dependent transporter
MDAVDSVLFTYYAKADLALSIYMTAVSTVVAIVAMPAMLFIYATPFTSEDLVMPYGSIISTLVVVLVPVFIGMAIRKKSLKAARITEKVGSLSGFAVLILLIGSSILQNKHLFATLTLRMYVAAIGLGCFGLLLGYLAALLLGLQEESRRAVSFETGIQNSPLAFAIVIASFSDALQQSILMQPMLYALFVLITSSLVAIGFRATGSRSAVEAQSTAA